MPALSEQGFRLKHVLGSKQLIPFHKQGGNSLPVLCSLFLAICMVLRIKYRIAAPELRRFRTKRTPLPNSAQPLYRSRTN